MVLRLGQDGRRRGGVALACGLAACGYPALPVLGGGGDAGDADDGSRTARDAAIDASPDALVCFGTGIVRVCLASVPGQALSISTVTAIDTSSSALCAASELRRPPPRCRSG